MQYCNALYSHASLFVSCLQWNADKIGWHESGVNESLLKHGGKIIPNFDKEETTCGNPVRVFFPLCGKSVDMAFLSKRQAVAEVVGVDGVRKALEEFGTENPDLEIKPVSSQNGRHERLEGTKITLLKGDFFDLDEEATNGRFEAIIDRASLVAIQPTLREDYVQVMSKLIQPGGKILLIVIERRSGTEEDMNGPPFSVPEAEVRRLYEGQDWVESVTLIDDNGEKAKNEGTAMASLYFLIQAK
jgi:thiopurine S-methyltransferase